MSDPSDLSPESRALLGREGPLDEPSGAELDARREAIFRALGVPLPAPLPSPAADAPAPPQPQPATAPTHPSGSATPGASAWPAGAKLALAVAAVVALGAGVLLLSPDAERDTPPSTLEGAPQPERADAEAPPRDELPGEPSEAAPADTDVVPAERPSEHGDGRRPSHAPLEDAPAVVPTPEPVTAAPPPPPPPTPVDELAPDPLSEESMLVAAGEAQLRAGHASSALTLFERALARHPSGTLRVEALAGRALSLCRAGRTEAGQREAARFLAAYPRSPSAPRIREACGVAP
jgi:hypothetical protein